MTHSRHCIRRRLKINHVSSTITRKETVRGVNHVTFKMSFTGKPVNEWLWENGTTSEIMKCSLARHADFARKENFLPLDLYYRHCSWYLNENAISTKLFPSFSFAHFSHKYQDKITTWELTYSMHNMKGKLLRVFRL